MFRLPRVCSLSFFAAVLLATVVGAETPRLRLPASINGKPMRFVFDTGITGFVIFRSTATRLGLHVTNPPADATIRPGEALVAHSDPCDLALLGAHSQVVFNVVADPPIAADFDGAIGWGPLSNNVWDISLPHHRFTFMSAVPAETKTWPSYRILPDTRLLCLEPATDAGANSRLELDTGDDSTITLLPAAWADWKSRHADASVTLDSFFMPGAGIVVVEQAWAHDLKIGDAEFHDVLVQQANPAEVALAVPGTVAILGFHALARADLILDGRNHTAYLRPLTNAIRPHDYNRLGAVFVPQTLTSDALVAHVRPNTPAAAAGIRDGDVLLRIDDRDVSTWRTDKHPVGDAWRMPAGTKHTLTLRRGTATLRIKVTLQDFLNDSARTR